MLFSISLCDAESFGIYVKEGEESATTLIEANIKDAELLFGMIHNGRLSALHLRDAANDFIKEKI